MNQPKIKKQIYLIRHGQSEHNVKPIFQGVHVSLTKHGELQAESVAQRVAKLDFELLISSSQKRALQTAEAISRLTKKPVQTSDLFVERIKPTTVNDKPYSDKQAAKVWHKWEKSIAGEISEKIEDGETQKEIIERADKALQYLLNRKEQTMAVVTHGYFLRTILARVLLQDELSSKNLVLVQQATGVENTGITILRYADDFEQDFAWRLWIFNDHAHLAE